MPLANISLNKFKIICRLCGEESSELIKLHLRKNRQRCLKESIKKFLGIKISPGDGLPDQICGPCIAKLDETKDFIEKCLKIQNNLQNISEASHAKSQSMELTIKAEPYDEPSSLLMENLVTSFLGENTEPVEEKPGISSSTGVSAEEKVATVSEKTNIPNTKDSNGTKPDESHAESLNEENISDFVDMTMIEGDKCPEENEKKQPSNILRLRARKNEIDPLRSCPREAQSVSSSTNKAAVVSQRKLVKLKRVPYKCAQCNKSYALKNSLKSHIKRVHNACMEKCPKCPKVLRSQYLWKTHILTHTCEKPFECDKCPKAYSTPLKLRLHKETHVPLDQRYKYECDVCGKKFTSKNVIKTHMKSHTGITPFICDQCGKSYQTKSNLQIHYRVHTGEKPYGCEVCGKRYAHVKPFKVHERTHTGTRPFTCSHCPKAFSSPWVLKRHVLIHTGIRPFPCRFCSKNFRDQWKRKVHERIHTGERPYKCSLCQSAFYESGNLQKHCRNVHNQDYRVPFVGKEDPEGEFPPSTPPEEEEESHASNPLLGHTIFSNDLEL